MEKDIAYDANRRVDLLGRSIYSTGNSLLQQMIKSSVYVMVIRMAGAGIAYLMQVLLAVWMGAFEYGIYAYVWVWLTIIGYLAPLGLNGSVVRFIPDYLEKQRWRRLKGVMFISRMIVLTASVCLAAIAVFLTYIFRESLPQYYIGPFFIAAVCIPLFAFLNLYEGTARSFGWVALAYTPTYIIRPVLFSLALAALFYTVGPVDSTLALQLVLGSVAVTVVWQVLILEWRLPEALKRVRPVYHTGYWMRISIPFLIIVVFQLVLSDVDIIMLGGFVPPEDVAVYFAAIRTAGLTVFFTFAVSAFAVPRYSALHAGGKKEALQLLVTDVVHLIFWPTAALSVILVIFGRTILGLFGPEFVSAYPVLVVLVVGYLLRAAAGPLDQLLIMTGHQIITVRILAAGCILSIFLNGLLIPAFGLMGAAIATTIANCVCAIFLLWVVIRRLQLNPLFFAGFGQWRAAARKP